MSNHTGRPDLEVLLDYFDDGKKWEVCTNRHPTCSGNSWGWIEGVPHNVCWSDDSRVFNGQKASAIVALHNLRVDRMKAAKDPQPPAQAEGENRD